MVTNIQRMQADDKDIYLRAEFYGFNDDYRIRTDEKRLAQVLMCL